MVARNCHPGVDAIALQGAGKVGWEVEELDAGKVHAHAREDFARLLFVRYRVAKRQAPAFMTLSPLGERVDRTGVFFSRGGPGEGVPSLRAPLARLLYSFFRHVSSSKNR